EATLASWLSSRGMRSRRASADDDPQVGGGDRGSQRTCPAAGATAGGRVLAGGRGMVPAAVRGGGPIAAVWRLPGSVAVLGDHPDRRLRRLRPRPPGRFAGVRVGVGL